MKATGIVRRIDDLGRVVIPKEIRRTMRIKEGESLEIFTDGNGGVVFKKYSPLGEMAAMAAGLCDVIARQCKAPVIICDNDMCIAAAGISKKEVLGRAVAEGLGALCDDRKSYFFAGVDALFPLVDCSSRAMAASPILSGGDVLGSVCALICEGERVDAVAVQQAVTLSALLFGSWMQE